MERCGTWKRHNISLTLANDLWWILFVFPPKRSKRPLCTFSWYQGSVAPFLIPKPLHYLKSLAFSFYYPCESTFCCSRAKTDITKDDRPLIVPDITFCLPGHAKIPLNHQIHLPRRITWTVKLTKLACCIRADCDNSSNSPSARQKEMSAPSSQYLRQQKTSHTGHSVHTTDRFDNWRTWRHVIFLWPPEIWEF